MPKQAADLAAAGVGAVAVAVLQNRAQAYLGPKLKLLADHPYILPAVVLVLAGAGAAASRGGWRLVWVGGGAAAVMAAVDAALNKFAKINPY